MRRIETSNGLEIGPREGPWLDLVSFPPGRRVEMPDAEELALDPASVWMQLPKDLPLPTQVAMPHAVGILGTMSDRSLTLRFMRPRGLSDVIALRKIAEADPIPPAVAGAVLAAATGLRHTEQLAGIGPATIAAACNLQPVGVETTHNSGEIRALASQFVHVLATGGDADIGGTTSRWVESADADSAKAHEVHTPTGAVDRARFWLQVSRELWEPKALRHVGMHNRAERPSLFLASQLATAQALLASLRVVQISDAVTARIDAETAKVHEVHTLPPASAWPQVVELAAGSISQPALSWMSGGHVPYANPTLDQTPVEGEPIPATPDEDLARALARQFLREAEDHGVYAPAGAFEVDIPQDLHLAGWDVSGMKIWCEPDRLWCGAVGDDGLSCIFEWRPIEGGGLRTWVMREQVKPAVHVTLAALWRDLHIAGEDALPHVGRQPPDRTTDARRPPQRSSARRRRRARRRLPDRRYVNLTGQRQWGSAEERETIRRRAHGVRGHLRKLPTGWRRSPEAVELAEQFGISLPDGYTFVRPHVRGGEGDAEAPDAAVVVSRGLLALTALLD